MENLSLILSMTATCLGLLITGLTFLLKFIKNAKAKKIAENIISIGGAIIPYIEQAEAFINYSGAEKKEFVMTKANQFAIEQGIDFNAELVSEKIEELVKLSKEINSREKDKAASVRNFQPITLNTAV